MEQSEQKTERIIFPASGTLVEAISEYWHERRLKSRADAIRTLIEAGLAAEGKKGKAKS